MASYNPYLRRDGLWKKIAWSLGLGVVLGFVAFVLSGEGGSSLALGLLVAYLEFRLSSRQ